MQHIEQQLLQMQMRIDAMEKQQHRRIIKLASKDDEILGYILQLKKKIMEHKKEIDRLQYLETDEDGEEMTEKINMPQLVVDVKQMKERIKRIISSLRMKI
jgi:SMC interacting uncharacterized protein involved in chromosome segregation